MRRRSASPERDKPIGWRGSSYRDLCAFPEEARREAGYQLHRLQEGRELADWKAMAQVGPGTVEIRIHGDTEHRVIVVARFEEAIYVLHAFQKKTRKASKHDIAIATRRYRELVAERRGS